MRHLRLLALILLVPLVVSCSSSNSAGLSQGCANAAAACLQGKALVEMTTSKGPITIEVDGDAAPLTWSSRPGWRKHRLNRDKRARG